MRCRSGKARWKTKKKQNTSRCPKARKKQNTLPDVQGLDLAYVSCAAGPARPDGKLRRNKTLPDVQRLDLAYVSSAAGPAKPDGKLKRNHYSAARETP
jgi:hypothetical protein